MSAGAAGSRFGAAAAREAAAAVTSRIANALGGEAPAAAIILGSGLGGLADRVEGSARVPFGEIPGSRRRPWWGTPGR